MKRIYRKAINAIKRRDEIWFPVFISALSLILIIIVLVITNTSNKRSSSQQILNDKTAQFCIGKVISDCDQIKIRQAFNLYSGELEQNIGLIPESRAYFLKIWLEKITVKTGNNEQKVVELLYKRALEAHIELLNGNFIAAKKALGGFEEIIDNVKINESDKSNLKTIFGYLSKEADAENREIILNLSLKLND
jgi:hypothetical protein